MGTSHDRRQWLYTELDEERDYQIEKGFTQTDDDELMPHMWVDLLDNRVEILNEAATPSEYRKQLIKVAAIAVAAVEAYDRAVH
jgi:hypothetical protein